MSITVVIPSYNHREYVLQAIESVLSQGVPDLDLIVIDDGSRDGSADLIREFWEKRGGFRFIARENRGLIRTLNEGLRLAQGEFFCELASDDYFPPDSLARRADFLQSHPECVAVFADGFRVQGISATDERFLDSKRKRMLTASDPIPLMLDGALPVFSTGLFRTRALQQINGFDEENFRFYEDLDTPIRLALFGKFTYLDAAVICRRQHGENVSSTTSHVRLEKALCYLKLLRDTKMHAYRRQLHRRFCRSLLALGRSMRERRGGSAAERSLFREGWAYVWREPRLLPYLLRYGRD